MATQDELARNFAAQISRAVRATRGDGVKRGSVRSTLEFGAAVDALVPQIVFE